MLPTADASRRFGCGESESLCIGSTHQKEFRIVLQKLAELIYVQRIDESFFEYTVSRFSGEMDTSNGWTELLWGEQGGFSAQFPTRGKLSLLPPRVRVLLTASCEGTGARKHRVETTSFDERQTHQPRNQSMRFRVLGQATGGTGQSDRGSHDINLRRVSGRWGL